MYKFSVYILFIYFLTVIRASSPNLDRQSLIIRPILTRFCAAGIRASLPNFDTVDLFRSFFIVISYIRDRIGGRLAIYCVIFPYVITLGGSK